MILKLGEVGFLIHKTTLVFTGVNGFILPVI